MTGVAKHTVLNLLRDLGCAAAAYHHWNVRGLRVRNLQCDEIWSFVGAKRKNVSPEKQEQGWGDVWTWTAIDADTKLCVSYLMGSRGKSAATEFMLDCASRIIGRPQITTDSHRPYFDAVEEAFGANADYAMLHKIYAAPQDDDSSGSVANLKPAESCCEFSHRPGFRFGRF
jgi:IS1 family transposase